MIMLKNMCRYPKLNILDFNSIWPNLIYRFYSSSGFSRPLQQFLVAFTAKIIWLYPSFFCLISILLLFSFLLNYCIHIPSSAWEAVMNQIYSHIVAIFSVQEIRYSSVISDLDFRTTFRTWLSSVEGIFYEDSL